MEAGALVLADKGACIIDELDKVKREDSPINRLNGPSPEPQLSHTSPPIPITSKK